VLNDEKLERRERLNERDKNRAKISDWKNVKLLKIISIEIEDIFVYKLMRQK
jgi:hypothetical protein